MSLDVYTCMNMESVQVIDSDLKIMVIYQDKTVIDVPPNVVPPRKR